MTTISDFKNQPLQNLITAHAAANISYIDVKEQNGNLVQTADHSKIIERQEGGPEGGAPGDEVPAESEYTPDVRLGWYVSVILIHVPKT